MAGALPWGPVSQACVCPALAGGCRAGVPLVGRLPCQLRSVLAWVTRCPPPRPPQWERLGAGAGQATWVSAPEERLCPGGMAWGACPVPLSPRWPPALLAWPHCPPQVALLTALGARRGLLHSGHRTPQGGLGRLTGEAAGSEAEGEESPYCPRGLPGLWAARFHTGVCPAAYRVHCPSPLTVTFEARR